MSQSAVARKPFLRLLPSLLVGIPLGVFVALPMVIVVHEFGHAFIWTVFGYTVRGIMLFEGPELAHWMLGSIHLVVNSIPSGGYTLITADPDDLWLIPGLLAGSFSPLLVSAGLVALACRASSLIFGWVVFGFGFMSLVSALLSLFPLAWVQNDGSQLMDLIFAFRHASEMQTTLVLATYMAFLGISCAMSFLNTLRVVRHMQGL